MGLQPLDGGLRDGGYNRRAHWHDTIMGKDG